MRIRQAGPDDADRLSRLACATYVEHFASFWQPDGLAAFLEREFAPATLTQALALPDQAWYVAGEDDAWLGYAKVNWRRTEPASGVNGAELQKIYFHAQAAGRGHGARLLAHVLSAARAQGEATLWLNVLADNSGARRFYLRHGFVLAGTTQFLADRGPIAMLTMARPVA